MSYSFLGKTFMAAVFLALAAPASAKQYDLGEIGHADGGGSKGGRFLVKGSGGNGSGSFKDSFTFNLSESSQVSLSRVFGGGNAGKNVANKSVVITIRDSAGNVVASMKGGKAASFVSELGEGSYTVSVSGNLKGNWSRGAYKLAANIVSKPGLGSSSGSGSGSLISVNPITPPVPEPEEWALMILGSGIMAYQVRRKQRKLAAEGEGPLTGLPA